MDSARSRINFSLRRNGPSQKMYVQTAYRASALAVIASIETQSADLCAGLPIPIANLEAD